jgi:hypothetical protein
MAMCPACSCHVRTPNFLNLDAWTHLACGHCGVRLEMKPPRSFVLGPLIAPLFVLARQGRVFEVIAFAYLCVTISLLLFESFRPKVRLRKKAPPKPDVVLSINGSPK